MRCRDLHPERTVYKASSGRRLHLDRGCKKLEGASNVSDSVARVEFDEHRVCSHCADDGGLPGLAGSIGGIDDL